MTQQQFNYYILAKRNRQNQLYKRQFELNKSQIGACNYSCQLGYIITSKEDIYNISNTLVGRWDSINNVKSYNIELFNNNTVISSECINNTTSCLFSNLLPNTEYTLNISANYINGKISKLESAKIKTGDLYTKTSSIPLPYTWVKNNLSIENPTDDDIENFAAANGLNNIPNTINYLFGISPFDENAKIYLDITDSFKKDTNNEPLTQITLKIPEAVENNIKTYGGSFNYIFNLKSSLSAELSGEFTTIASVKNINTIVINANNEQQNFWKGELNISYKCFPNYDFTYNLNIEASNIVGLTRYKRIYTSSYDINKNIDDISRDLQPITIAYNTSSYKVENMTVSKFIGTENIDINSILYVYNKAYTGNINDIYYYIFKLILINNKKVWKFVQATTRQNIVVDIDNKTNITADTFQLFRGYGCWLALPYNSIVNYIHVFGQIPYTDAPDAVVEIAAHTHSLIGAQHYQKFQFKKGQALPESYRKVFTDKDGDVIQIKQASGATYEYKYRINLGGWSRYEDDGVHLWVIKNFSVPVGQAFYYSNNSKEAIELNWSAK